MRAQGFAVLQLLVVLGAALAGCALPFGRSPHAAVACDEGMDDQAAAGPGEAVAPRWGERGGRRWTYDILNETGGAYGTETHEVLGCRRVLGVIAYEVRMTREEQRPGAGGPSTRTTYYERSTLNQVWDVCGSDEIMHGECSGRLPEWNFTLRDGKTWQYSCCGDVVTLYHAASNATADGAFVIEYTADLSPGPDAWTQRWIYDPEQELFTRFDVRTHDGRTLETRSLREAGWRA